MFARNLLKIVAVISVSMMVAPITMAGEFFDAYVDKVMDGDTIHLRGGTVVRYMGIETPRTRIKNQIFMNVAQQSLALNKKLVEKKKVRLEIVEPVNVDRDDTRKFAYVFVSGQMVNAVLLKKGLALISKTFPPDEKYQGYFVRSQNEAINLKKGIWEKLSANQQAAEKKNYAFQ